jgi:transcription elongation factor Elf1
MTQRVKLDTEKTCPNCGHQGGPVHMQVDDVYDRNSHTTWWVECENCRTMWEPWGDE